LAPRRRGVVDHLLQVVGRVGVVERLFERDDALVELVEACSKVWLPGTMAFSMASLISPSSPFSISSAM
jgi:hypothetical protein